jgi:hypothetical protein
MAAKLDNGASHQSCLLNEFKHNDDPVAPYTQFFQPYRPIPPTGAFSMARENTS